MGDETIGRITNLFQASYLLGYIPECWRVSNVIFIPKPGKDDYQNSKHNIRYWDVHTGTTKTATHDSKEDFLLGTCSVVYFTVVWFQPRTQLYYLLVFNVQQFYGSLCLFRSFTQIKSFIDLHFIN